MGKMRKKNVPKEKVKNASKVGDRLFLDFSSNKYPSMGGAKFLCLMMDDHSGFLIAEYLKQKSDLAEKGVELINKLENDFDLKVRRICYDYAGENKILEKECTRRKMGVMFEYTSVNTPQQNGRIERKFATLHGRVQSMFVAAGIDGSLRKLLWAEAMNTAVDINNIFVNQQDEKSPYKMMTRGTTPPKYAMTLQRFGEIGIVPNRTSQHKSKITNRGKAVLMVGYNRQSAQGVYRILNFKTKKFTQSRDVKWCNQMYASYKNLWKKTMTMIHQVRSRRMWNH